MKLADNIEKLIRDLNVLKIDTSTEVDQKIIHDALKEQEKFKGTKSAEAQPSIRRMIMKRPITKIAAAAVIIIAVLIGINYFGGSIDGSGAVWGKEITKAIEKVHAVSCREQIFIVAQDGTKHLSSTWDILYISKDSYRRDIYDGNTLREIQWYVPDGENTIHHSIRFDLKSYFATKGEGSFGVQDPVDRVRSCVRFLNGAKNMLGIKKIEDVNCVGFEIKASEYGNNPESWVDRIWFDAETKLPVVIEKLGRPVTGHPEMTFTTVQDEFSYNDELPEDTFEPYIPEGYVFGHPDDITSK